MKLKHYAILALAIFAALTIADYSSATYDVEVYGTVSILKEYDPPIVRSFKSGQEIWLRKVQIKGDDGKTYRLYETVDSDMYDVKEGDRVLAIYEPFRTHYRGCLEQLIKQ